MRSNPVCAKSACALTDAKSQEQEAESLLKSAAAINFKLAFGREMNEVEKLMFFEESESEIKTYKSRALARKEFASYIKGRSLNPAAAGQWKAA